MQPLAGNRAAVGLVLATRALPGAGAGTTAQRQGAEEAPADTADEGWTDTGVSAIVRDATGANVRDRPAPPQHGSTIVAHLGQNTRVLGLRHNPRTRWHEVRVIRGDQAGIRGYVVDWLLRTDAPDAESVIHDVVSGDRLGELVQNHPQYAGYPIVTGDDARSLVMAVYTANLGSDGVRLVGEPDDGLLASAMDMADDYRAVTRRIYQTIELVAGEQIWLPGTGYIDALKSAGAIPQRADWKNAAIETGKRVAGLQVGLLEGVVGALVDLVAGVAGLAKGAVDLIVATLTGEAFAVVGELIDALGELIDEGQVLQFAQAVAAGLVHTVIDAGKSFLERWQEPPVYDAWRFRGMVVGYVIAEVVMALLTGALSALKWLDKLGDVGRIVRRVIGKVDGVVDDLPSPNAATRHRRGHTAEGMDGEFVHGPLPEVRDDVPVVRGRGPLRSEDDAYPDYADALRTGPTSKNPATSAARGQHGPHIRDNLYLGDDQRRVTDNLIRHRVLDRAPDGNSVRIRDADRYLAWLERAYRHHGGSHLDDRVALAVREYVAGGRDIPAVGVGPGGRSSFAGSLPGTHAEVLAVNDALLSGQAGAVATVRARAGGHFVACLHCGGILGRLARTVPEVRILTGAAAPRP